MPRRSVKVVPSPFVVLPEVPIIKKEKLEELEPETHKWVDTPVKSNSYLITGTSAINNNEKLEEQIVIKQEPIDKAETEVEVPEVNASQVVSIDQVITIKTEARVLDDDEGEEGEVDVDQLSHGSLKDGSSNNDDDNENEEEEDPDLDEDLEFDDDSNDSDFEMDLSEEVDSPAAQTSQNADSPDSLVLDMNLVKEELEDTLVDIENPSLEEGSNSTIEGDEDSLVNAKRGSFDFNGTRIETVGNYSKCPTCKKNIKSTFIIRHIKLHNLPEEKYKCPEKKCNLMVNRINNLFRHLKVVHRSKKPYLCKDKNCTERFAKASGLRTHFAKHREERRKLEAEQEGPNKIYACEFPGCGKEYKKRHHLKEHERKHTGDMKYACEVCGKRFYIQAHMKRHLYSHTGIKPHVCRWKCGAIFASYGGRMKHERINHYDENPLQSKCDICGRPFKNQQQLVKHRMTHLNPDERKDYRCSFCHIMFDTIKLRERHEERHKDGEVFSCETCEKVFKNEKNLNHHVKTHHIKATDKPTTPNAKKTKKEPPPKHPCHICGPPKMYCLTSLRRHLARIHSTNFKCPREECGKCFKEKFQLDAHVEIHRLRECHLCGKKFQRKQNADIHLLGVHALTVADLSKLGRWNPKNEGETAPDYMTRKTNVTFKNFRKKAKGSSRESNELVDGDENSSTMDGNTSSHDGAQILQDTNSSSNDFIAIDDIKDEPVDIS